MAKKILIFSIFLTIVLVITGITFYHSGYFTAAPTDAGGFGISPPYFNNDDLGPGDVYQDQIYALRSDDGGIAGVTVKITAPEIESWLSLYPGPELKFVDGSLEAPVLIKAIVPADAKSGVYKGYIDFYHHKSGGLFKKGNQVQLGARADIRLTVNGSDNGARVIKDIVATSTASQYALNNDELYGRWKGFFLSAAAENQNLYYVDPLVRVIHDISTTSLLAKALAGGAAGISNADLDKIAIAPVFNAALDSDEDGLPDFFEQAIGTDPARADTDGDRYKDKEELDKNYDPLQRRQTKKIDDNLSAKLAGRIMLQVENRGQLWYVNPADKKRYYLGNNGYAGQLIANLALPIDPAELSRLINVE